MRRDSNCTQEIRSRSAAGATSNECNVLFLSSHYRGVRFQRRAKIALFISCLRRGGGGALFLRHVHASLALAARLRVECLFLIICQRDRTRRRLHLPRGPRTFRHVCCCVRGSSFGFNIMKPAVPLPRGALIFRSRPRYIGETRDEIGKNRITVHARRRGNRRMGCGALWSACRSGRIIWHAGGSRTLFGPQI